MKDNNRLELTPTKNPLKWKDDKPFDICPSWYMMWYRKPWKFGYFNALKSRETEITHEVKDKFIELLQWRIDFLKKTGSTPVIVMPPVKKTWDQTMGFVMDRIQDVEFIRIKSPEYRGLHFLEDQVEREHTIQLVFKRWKVKFNPAVLEAKKVVYIFVDDFYITGTTTRAIVKAINANKRLANVVSEDSIFTNFEGMYMARAQNKRNVKSKNMWIVDVEFSGKINNIASKGKFTNEKRDTTYFRKAGEALDQYEIEQLKQEVEKKEYSK